MEEHRKLYGWFLANGHIGDDTSFEDFYDGFKDIENVKGIYGFIKSQNATEQTIDDFGAKYFVKKKDSSQESGNDYATSAQPGTVADGQDNFSPIEFDRSVGVQNDNTVTADRGLRYDPVAELTLTGKEDIGQYQESIRAKNEGEAYGSRLAVDQSKDLRREAREADNTIKYGQTAINQVKYADGRLKSMFGENWENELSSLVTELNQGAIATRESEIRKRISDITQNEWYQKYAGGAEAAANAEAKYYLHVNNGALAAYKKEQERQQQIADQNYQDSYWKPARDFILRKGMNTLGSILTAPRTFGTAISGGSSQVTVADAIGAFGDDIFAMSELTFPKPSELQVSTFEDVVDFNGQKVVVDNNGIPSQIIKDGKRYQATPEFISEYNASPDDKKTRVSYTGNAPLLDKVAESAADLFLMRYAGGGTTAGTMASSVVIAHNGLYQEALAAGMSADQAAEYAASGALLTGAVEGYIGGFETKLFKPFATTAAKSMTKSAAKLVAEGMSPGQAAWSGLKMVVKETSGEVKEEVIQSMVEDYNRKVFTSSIAPLEDQMNTKSLGETVLATTLLTAPLAALGIKGYNTASRKSAMLSAINNPDQFKNALDGLVTDGVITREKADRTIEKVAKLAVYNNSLPDGLSLDDRADLLAKQDYADDKAEEAQDESQLPAARDVARKAATETKKEIENTIRAATGIPIEETNEASTTDPGTPALPETTTPVVERAPESTIEQAGPEVFAEKVAAFAKDRNVLVAPQSVEEAFQNIPPGTPVDQAAFDFVTQNTPPAEFSLPENTGQPDFVDQAMTNYIASGGQISDVERASNPQASSAWFNEDAPSVTELATDISRQTGMEVSEVKSQIESFVAKNPERLASVATERSAVAAVSEAAVLDGEDITVTPQDAQEAIAYQAPEVTAISQNEELATQVAEQYNNDPVAIADAIENGDITIPQNVPVQDIPEGQLAPMAAAQPREEVASQAPADAGQIEGGETPDTETGYDGQRPVVEPLRIDNINTPEVAGASVDQGVDPSDAVSRAAGDIGLPVGPAMSRKDIQEHTERQVREAVDTANQEMATDGPAIVYSGEEIIVVNADGLQDAMRDAGGRYEYGRGWVFPKDSEPAVRATMATQTPSHTDRQQFARGGSSGRMSASVRDKFVAAANAMRKRRIRKAKTIDEAMDIVAEDGNVAAEGVRDARIQHVTDMLRRAFPGIQIVTDPTVIDSMAIPGQPAGFVKDGVVYIDMRRAGPDTAMHEFGHVWMMASRDTELYQIGIDSVIGSEYEKTIREDPRYDGLSDQEVYEEALALAIGERGARIVAKTKWEKFVAFLSGIADYFKYKIGAGVDPMNMTADEFADIISHQIMKGGDYTSKEIARIQGDLVKFQYDAQNAQQDQDIARKMRSEGYDLTSIRAITGWTIGADGRWEWRPSDSEVAPDVRLALDGEVIDLSDLMFNGPLFKADPEIQKMKVLFSSQVDSPQIGVQPGGVFLVMPVGSNKDNVTEPVRRLVTNLSKIRKGMGINVLIASEVDPALTPIDADTDVALKKLMQSWRDMGLSRPGMMSEDEVGAVIEKLVSAWRGMSMEKIGLSETQKYPESVPVSPSTEAALGGAARDFVPGFDDFSGEGRYDAEKDALRKAAVRQGASLIIEKAIKQGGSGVIQAGDVDTSKEAMANKLFDRFGIDHTWSYNEWDRIASQQAGGKRFFDTTGIRKAMDKAGVWWQKNLVYRGQLPKDIYDLNRRRAGEVNALMSSMDSLASQLESAMKKEFGTLTAENRALVDSILKGDTHINAVSPELGSVITNMRAFVDQLSIRILRAGGLTKASIIKIIDGVGIAVYDQSGDIMDDVNEVVGILSIPPYDRTPQENEIIDDFLKSHSDRFGTYLNRSYRVHDFPDWKDRIAPDVVRDAEIYIQAELQREADEIAQGLAEYEDDILRQKAALDKRAADLIKQVEQDLENATEPADITRLTGVLEEMNEILAAVEGTPEYQERVLDEATTKGVARAVTMIRAARRKAYKLEQKLKMARPEAVERLTALHGRIKNIKGEINRVLDYDAPMANVQNKGVLGAKDRGILKRREDLAPEIRALLGEYTDPVINFTKSIAKMSHLAANTEFLNSMRKRYEGVYFFEAPGVNNENWKQFGSTGNANLAPLAGWYTTPEIYDAMTEFYEPAQMDWWQKLWITQFVQAIKLGKTVLSPETHPRNFFGNAMFHVVHGWNPINAADAMKTWANRNSDPEAWRALKEKYYRLGIFGESVTSNDIKEIMTDIEDRFTRNKFDSTGGAVTNAVASSARFVFNKAKKLYEAEDEIHRIMAFENESARYAKALYGRPISELSPEQRTAVEERAADIVSHIMPTASFVPRLLKHIRRFPFTGTFVTFPAEMIRVTWNTVDLAKTEMKDPRTRAVGVRRLLGLTTAVAGMQALTLALRAAFGYDDEYWEAINYFQPEYAKYSQLVPVGPNEKGQARWWNASYTNPFSFINKSWNAVLMNDNPGTGIAHAVESFFDPFISPELTFNTIDLLIRNKDDRYEDIRVESLKDPIFGTSFLHKENLKRSLAYAGKKLSPGIVKSSIDAWNIAFDESDGSGRSKTWATYATAHLLGARIENFDPIVSANAKASAAYAQKQAAMGIYKDTQYKMNRAWKNMHNEATEPTKAREDNFHREAIDELNKAYEVSMEAYISVIKECHKLYNHGIKVGIPPADMSGIFKDRHFSDENGEIQAIVSGNTSYLRLRFKKKDRY